MKWDGMEWEPEADAVVALPLPGTQSGRPIDMLRNSSAKWPLVNPSNLNALA